MSSPERCQKCGSAIFNRPMIQVQANKRKWVPIDAKICRHCNVIYPLNKEIGFWNGIEIIEAK